jgi:hypothetical protein
MKSQPARHLFLLLALYIFAEVLVNPLGDFPLNDDWSYTKSAIIFCASGRVEVGTWAAMSLVTHLIWGCAFGKVFGMTFAVLRFSTLVSSLTGIFFLYRLVHRVTARPMCALAASLVTLFNPYYFNLSNTYMTDVNFNTLMVIFFYVAYRFFESGRLLYLLPAMLLSFMLVFIRQIGIVLPFALIVAIPFMRGKRKLPFILLCANFVLIYISLAAYERQLRPVMPDWAAFRFSGNIHPADPEFYTALSAKFLERWNDTIAHVLVFAFPFAVFYLPVLIRQCKRYRLLATMCAAVLAAIAVGYDARFPVGNILGNLGVGPETFFQNRFGQLHKGTSNFTGIMSSIKYSFASGTLVMMALSFRRGFISRAVKNPFAVLLAACMLCYVFLLFVSDSFIDRYFLPLSTILIVGLSAMARSYTLTFRPVTLLVPVALAYISVAGTHDYLKWNSMRWLAYSELRSDGVGVELINGGFEVNCWDDGRYGWGCDFDKPGSKYLIQFTAEPGFSVYRSYTYINWFPPRRDTVKVFTRDGM